MAFSVEIGGFEAVSLIDYPGMISSIVFFAGCNMRCPFCHNPNLVLRDREHLKMMAPSEALERLSEMSGFIDGVTITGGEPLIQPGIEDFIDHAKSIGLKVKLDTNGLSPDQLQRVIASKMVDYIAMDIKAPLEGCRYEKAAGIPIHSLITRIRRSIDLIKNSGISHEFRTTVVPGIISPDELPAVAEEIKGADAYYLQQFRNKVTFDQKLHSVPPFSAAELESACFKIKGMKLVKHCAVR